MDSDGCKVYIGNLPSDVREGDLEPMFSKSGRIVALELKTPMNGGAFAFVTYEDRETADRALRDWDGKSFGGSSMRVEIARGRPRDRTGGPPQRGYKVSISGLDPGMSWQDLKDFLKRIGQVNFTKVDRNGGGVADFATERDAERAVKELDNTEHRGSVLRLNLDGIGGPPPRDGGRDFGGRGRFDDRHGDYDRRGPRRSDDRYERRYDRSDRGGSGIDRYGDSYNGRDGDRYGDQRRGDRRDDRYGDRYGSRYDDRYGDRRGGGGGDRYGRGDRGSRRSPSPAPRERTRSRSPRGRRDRSHGRY